MKASKILLTTYLTVLAVYFAVTFCDHVFDIGHVNRGPCHIRNNNITEEYFNGEMKYVVALNITYPSWYGRTIHDTIKIPCNNFYEASAMRSHYRPGKEIQRCCPKLYPDNGFDSIFTSETDFIWTSVAIISISLGVGVVYVEIRKCEQRPRPVRPICHRSPRRMRVMRSMAKC